MYGTERLSLKSYNAVNYHKHGKLNVIAGLTGLIVIIYSSVRFRHYTLFYFLATTEKKTRQFNGV